VAGVRLRPAAGSDAEALARTMAAAFDAYRAFAPAGWAPPTAPTEVALLRGLLGRPEFWCLVAEADDALAGHVALLPAELAHRPVREPGLGHLRQLFVVPEHWGTGLASALHAAALEAAPERGFRALRLFTPAGQARARRFYAREGWRPAGPPFADPGFGLEVVEYRRALSAG
jgi:GNAT superfamily N-acetyltransferase